MNRAIEHWDDEREPTLGSGFSNGIIVTLHYGWSFEPNEHLGVKGFDTIREAREETKIKNLFRCTCDECQQNEVSR